MSSWTPVLRARTRQEPVRGGGTGPGYLWEQTPTDVMVTMQVVAREREGMRALQHATLLFAFKVYGTFAYLLHSYAVAAFQRLQVPQGATKKDLKLQLLPHRLRVECTLPKDKPLVSYGLAFPAGFDPAEAGSKPDLFPIWVRLCLCPCTCF